MSSQLSTLDNSSLDPDCVGQRYWYVFLMSSLLTCFGGLIIIYIWRITTYVFYNYWSKRVKANVSYHNLNFEKKYFISTQWLVKFICFKF